MPPRSGDDNRVDERRDNEWYRALFEAAGLGVLVADFETRRFVDANPAICDMLGYTKDELLSCGVEDVHPVEALPEVVAEFEAQSRGEKLVASGLPVLRKDGTVFHADIATTPAQLGDRLCNVGLFEDVTRRRLAERALRESRDEIRREREQLLSIFDSIDEVIYVADPETYEILYANETCRRHFGEIVGRRCYEGLQARDKPCPFCTNDRILGENLGKTHIWEFQNRKTNHRFRCIDRAIRWPDSRWVRCELAIDIEEQKRAEAERLRAQKLSSVGLLAGGIAHDFNNLLAAIVGHLVLARTGVPAHSPSAAALNEAEAAAFRARDLTRQLLTFSKGGEPVKRVASVGEIVAETARFTLSGSSVCLDFSAPSDLWLAEVDTGQISQVVTNLVLNAVHSMSHGGTVTIRCRNRHVPDAETSEDHAYVEVEIQDHGAGIAKEDLDHIFDPYFTTRATGTGLGLTMVHSIVTRHGGSVEVESERGKGTTFRFRVPAAPEAVVPVATESPSEKPRAHGRVLVLDDDASVLAAAVALVESLGYESVGARDGATAVARFEAARASGSPFDLVVLDLTLPGGTGGREVLAQLRAFDPDIRAVASSGYSNDPVMAQHRAHGFSAALPKPYSRRTLAEILGAALANPA